MPQWYCSLITKLLIRIVIYSLVILYAFFVLTIPINANYEPVIHEYTPEGIKELAYTMASKHGIDAEAFVATMSGESINFTWNKQSLVRANGPHGREDSWGICQIHAPSHPRIEKQWMLDPAWCLEWSAIQFKNGRANMWTEYRKYRARI